MAFYRVFAGRGVTLASVIVAATVLVTAVSSPAEARRRTLHKGGGYSPPYAAMVVDVKTGKVLHAENEDALRHPASVTKVMTLYLLFEQLEKGRFRLDSELKISAHAARQAPSKLGLKPGETIEVEDAIKALVTKSANDIAVAVAENIGGTEEGFADMMTRKARQLGMNRTVYKNASGLPDTGQVTTARDLVTLGRAIQDRFPTYYRYFSTPTFSYAGATHRNHNRLLGRVEGMDGIKTGYTRMSGFNLLTSVKTEGRHVVGVVLGGRSAASRDRQMADLLDQSLERAYAGNRTAPAVGEGTAVADRDPPKEAVRTRVASLDDEVPTAAVTPKAAAAPAPAPKTIDVAAARPVVASAVGTSTSTPTSTGSLRWAVGAQPVTETGKPDAKAAKAEPAKPEPTKVARLETGKPEAKADPKAEKKAEAAKSDAHKTVVPKSALSGWVIQLGATDDEAKAKEILSKARSQSRALAKADPFTEKVSKGGSTLYRARFSGFDEDDAQTACKSLKRSGFACFAVKGG